jgi:dihydrofolate reductase
MITIKPTPKSKIILVAAHSLNYVIGNNNTIPWKIDGEQKYFKQLTEGHTVVMGRKTFESIGKELPKRENIILTTKTVDGLICFNNISDVLSLNRDKLFVIGGQSVYEQFLPFADEAIISVIQKECNGDAYFPKLEERGFYIANSQLVYSNINYVVCQYLKTIRKS